MTQKGTIRIGPTGPPLVGTSDGDTLQWNATLRVWQAAAGGQPIADGEFEGQMLYWTGSAWQGVPTGLGPVARIEGLTSVDPSSAALLLGIDSVQLNANLGSGTITFTSHAVTQTMQDVWTVSLGSGDNFLQLDTSTGLLLVVEPILGAQLTNQLASYTLEIDGHRFSTPDPGGFPETHVQISSALGVKQLGFFGFSPIPQQSITGATTQDQVDSIISALVAFGLVTDDR